MVQDITIEHDNPEVIARAIHSAVDWGARLTGYFICPIAPVVSRDEYPSHTLACYREYHQQPHSDAALPLSGFIASIGACNCFGAKPTHTRYDTVSELSAAVLELLRNSDPSAFLKANGHDGPFHGTDATIKAGFRLHHCSWSGAGLWLSFRHIYVGK